jgi:hypothetical protein
MSNPGSLVIYLLVGLFIAQFFKYPMKLSGKDAKLQMLMAANDVSHPKIPEFRPKLRYKGSSFQTKITLAVKVAQYGHTPPKHGACC